MSNIKNITVPDIGDFSAVPVIEVPVAVGDVVAEGDTLVVLESDKSTLEVPAETAGVVVEIIVNVDDSVSEGSLIMTIAVEQAAAENNSVETEGVVVESASDDRGGQSPASVATDSADSNSTDSKPATNEPDSTSDETQTAAGEQTETLKQVIYASPSIRRYARQLGVSIDTVDGTGPKQRITREDVEQYVKSRLSGADNDTASAYSIAGLPDWPQIDHAKFGPVERTPLSRIGKISGPALARNAMVIPHVTHFDKTDVTELEAFRKELNAEAAAGTSQDHAKITMLTFAVKAAVSALMTFPKFNSSLEGDELIIKQYWNIGVAADTPEGLLVPVIKDADKKGFREIADEMAELAAAARQGKLAPASMQGATFTISSLGGIGGTNFTPIINAPEVAILGMPRSEMQPVWDGQAFAPKLIQPLSLSFDHRVVDGVAAAKFLAHIASVLNDLRRINV